MKLTLFMCKPALAFAASANDTAAEYAATLDYPTVAEKLKAESKLVVSVDGVELTLTLGKDVFLSATEAFEASKKSK